MRAAARTVTAHTKGSALGRYEQKLANSQMELAEAKKLLSALGNLHAEPSPSGSAAQPRSRRRRRVQHCGRRACCAGCCGVACVGASKRGLRQCSRAAASGGEGGERSRARAACEGAREVPAAPGVARAPHRLFSAAKGRYNSGHGRTYRCMECAAGPYPATAAVLIAHPCCGHGTCTHSHRAKPHEQHTHRHTQRTLPSFYWADFIGADVRLP
jgi:hypothetical protein